MGCWPSGLDANVVPNAININPFDSCDTRKVLSSTGPGSCTKQEPGLLIQGVGGRSTKPELSWITW